MSGLAVFVALVVLAALSLDAGARLGAATTLIVTAGTGQNAVSGALARGANIPLGCAVAVAVGLVLWPQRAAHQLRADLQADVLRAGALMQSGLLTYVGIAIYDGLLVELDGLARRKSARATTLRDAAREPERRERLLALRRDASSVEALIDGAGMLVRPCLEGANDGAPSLVRGELDSVAQAIAATTHAVGSTDEERMRESLKRLTTACSALDAGFAHARARRATVTLPTAEIGRLLAVIRAVRHVRSVLFGFGIADDPAETAGG